MGTTWEYIQDSAGEKEDGEHVLEQHPGLASHDGPYSAAPSGRLVASWCSHKLLIVELSRSQW